MSKAIRKDQETMGAVGIDANLNTITNDVSQVGIVVLAALAALIGIWGLACLVGGIISSESILEMARGYVAAVTGN